MDTKKVRIAFLGTPEISAYVLENLINGGYNVVAVISQEDKIVDKKGNLKPTPTKIIAQKYNIPCYQFDKIRLHVDEVRNIDIECIITLAYGQLISHEILEMPKYGCINLHGSLLPKYRGAAPIQASLINGDHETGFTLMQMVDKMDAGLMYAKKVVLIDEKENYSSLLEKMKVCAKDLLLNSIDDYLNGRLKGQEQNEEDVTFAKKISREMEKLDLLLPKRDFVNMVRALSKIPGGYLFIDDLILKIFSASIVNNEINGNVGEIVKADKNGFWIQLSDGIISVEYLQKQNKKEMGYKDFINGNRDLLGKILK